jgi:hypothetical protein
LIPATAKRPGDQHAFPAQPSSSRRNAHGDVVNLALENGRDEDAQVEKHTNLVIWSFSHLVIVGQLVD